MEIYKKCPLKKRPIVVNEPITEQPEDLSLKKIFKKDIIINSTEKKRHFDLSSNSYYDCLRKTNEIGFWYQSIAENFKHDHSVSSSTTVSNDVQIISAFKKYHNSIINQQYETLSPNIHLRGLTNLEIKNFHYNSYWNPLHLQNHNRTTTHQQQFISSEFIACNLTPPSSPASVISSSSSSSSEPEDLSIRNGEFSIKSLLYPSMKKHNVNSKGLKIESIQQQQQPIYRFQCDKCRKSYSTSTGLSKHQQLHCPAAECNKIKKEFDCKSCDKVYTSLGALKMHIRTHTLPCKCPHCGKAFSRPWLLQGHIRTHTGEKPFSCSHCQRAFADRSNLRAHQQTHVEVKKYICEICSKSFSRMSLLSKHISGGCVMQMKNYI